MDCTDAEKRLYWSCMQMETRYGQDMRLPDSGLTSLQLITEMYIPHQIGIEKSIPKEDGVSCSSHLYHSSYLFHCIPRFGLKTANLLYGREDARFVLSVVPENPPIHETPEIIAIEEGLQEWYLTRFLFNY